MTVLVAAATGSLTFLVVVIILTRTTGESEQRADGDRLRPAILGMCGAAILACAFIVISGSLSFADSGKVKSVLLPLTFAILIYTVLFQTRSLPRLWSGSMLWVPALVFLLEVGIFAAELNSEKTSLIAMGQDLVIFGALAIGALAARPMSVPRILSITVLLWWTSVILSLVGVAVGPFTALVIPALGGSLICWRSLSSWHRSIPPLIAIGIIYEIATSVKPWMTGARILEIFAVVGTYGFYIWARKAPPFVTMLAVAILVGLVSVITLTPVQQLVGRASSPDDVTVQQRYYELQRVNLENRQSTLTSLIGKGPGGTVDLSQSPDAATLASSGRTLQAVDDAHLLLAHITMKFGVLGVAWLLLLMACFLRLIYDTAQLPGDKSGLGILMFLGGFIAYGAPAASNFIGNPLFGLLFAILALSARVSLDQVGGSGGSVPDRGPCTGVGASPIDTSVRSPPAPSRA